MRTSVVEVGIICGTTTEKTKTERLLSFIIFTIPLKHYDSMDKGEDSYLKIGEDGEDSHSQIAQKALRCHHFLIESSPSSPFWSIESSP